MGSRASRPGACSRARRDPGLAGAAEEPAVLAVQRRRGIELAAVLPERLRDDDARLADARQLPHLGRHPTEDARRRVRPSRRRSPRGSRARPRRLPPRPRTGVHGAATTSRPSTGAGEDPEPVAVLPLGPADEAVGNACSLEPRVVARRGLRSAKGTGGGGSTSTSAGRPSATTASPASRRLPSHASGVPSGGGSGASPRRARRAGPRRARTCSRRCRSRAGR